MKTKIPKPIYVAVTFSTPNEVTQDIREALEKAGFKADVIEIAAPKKLKKPKIVLCVEGGVIHEVISNQDVEVLTIDADTDGKDEEELTAVPQGDDPDEMKYLRREIPTIDVVRVKRLMNLD